MRAGVAAVIVSAKITVTVRAAKIAVTRGNIVNRWY